MAEICRWKFTDLFGYIKNACDYIVATGAGINRYRLDRERLTTRPHRRGDQLPESRIVALAAKK